MSPHNTLTPDPRDRRPAARPLAAQARTVTVTADHYLAQMAQLRAGLAAQIPITEADFVSGPDPYADAEPVL